MYHKIKPVLRFKTIKNLQDKYPFTSIKSTFLSPVPLSKSNHGSQLAT